MPSVKATVGNGRTGSDSELVWGTAGSADSSLDVAIPADLVAEVSGSKPANVRLRYLRIVDFGLVQIDLHSDTQSVAGAGPDLSNDWETYAEAIIISAGPVRIVLPGPNAPGQLARDPTEPYRYNTDHQTHPTLSLIHI